MSKKIKPKGIFIFISKVIRKLDRDRVGVYAAQASFFVTISFIPCIMLALSVLGYILPTLNIDIESMLSFLPGSIFSFIETALAEIINGAKLSVLSITTIAMVWAASLGIRSLSDGIREVYGGKESQKWFFMSFVKSILYTVLFVIIIAAMIVLLVFGNVLWSYVPQNMVAANTILGLRGIIFLVLLTLLFMLAYRGFSKVGICFRHHFLGAAFSAVGWLVYSWIFSLYIEHFANYSLIYGGLAAIVVFMLWLYMCMQILLIGAEINAYLSGTKHD